MYVVSGDADAAIIINSMKIIAPVQTGATTLQLQVRSTTTGKNIGGAGAASQIYAEWVKNG